LPGSRAGTACTVAGRFRAEALQDGQQVLVVLRAKDRADIGPAARARLPGDEAEGEGLDHLLVFGIAEPIEEQDGERQLVGGLQIGCVSAQEIGSLLHVGVIGRHATLQQTQPWESRVADRVCAASQVPFGCWLVFR